LSERHITTGRHAEIPRRGPVLSKKILRELKDAVVAGDVKNAKKLAEQSLRRKLPANAALETLMAAMKAVDERYARKEYFVAEVAQSASAMREAFKILQPHMQVDPALTKDTIVIGSLKGNIQGLGKDIVAATLQSAGFRVVNLGVDVDPEDFVGAAVRERARIVAVSISMRETVSYLADLVNLLDREDLRDRVKVLIGGNAVSERTCRAQGGDAYAVDAREALLKVNELLARKPRRADDS
jgi:methanogenic corrinoid protein MtbC1